MKPIELALAILFEITEISCLIPDKPDLITEIILKPFRSFYSIIVPMIVRNYQQINRLLK